MTVEAEGTLTTTTSEQTLTTKTTAGTYVLTLNTKNVALGDEFVFRIYVKVLTGDSQHYLAYEATYAHQQGDGSDIGAGTPASGDVVKISPPVVSPYSICASIIKIAGTNRNIDWQLTRL